MQALRPWHHPLPPCRPPGPAARPPPACFRAALEAHQAARLGHQPARPPALTPARPLRRTPGAASPISGARSSSRLPARTRAALRSARPCPARCSRCDRRPAAAHNKHTGPVSWCTLPISAPCHSPHGHERLQWCTAQTCRAGRGCREASRAESSARHTPFVASAPAIWQVRNRSSARSHCPLAPSLAWPTEQSSPVHS